jgi:aspartyl-tRNA(Asn)/glutamyl-tRNA(Gln) amidotransferase subunit C
VKNYYSETTAKQVITPEEVEHIAHLSRLELRAGDREIFAKQLNCILGYVTTLEEIDTDGIDPTFHPAPLSNVMRKDEIKKSLPREETIKNAPQKEDHYFRMPPVLGSSFIPDV